MSKQCALCGLRTEDERAFAEHMRATHNWGAPATRQAVVFGAGGATPPPDALVHVAAPDDTSVPKFCGSCGAPRDAASTNFCRNCGAPFTGTPTGPHEASPAFAPKGGFWRRTGAYLLDAFVLGLVGYAAGLLVGVIGVAMHMRQSDIDIVGQLVGDVLGLAYFLYFWSAHGAGQTPGMRALHLRVIRTDGQYMSVGRAFLRNIGLGISTIVVGLGLIWVAFDKNKQGWHDKIADTYVIRTA